MTPVPVQRVPGSRMLWQRLSPGSDIAPSKAPPTSPPPSVTCRGQTESPMSPVKIHVAMCKDLFVIDRQPKFLKADYYWLWDECS